MAVFTSTYPDEPDHNCLVYIQRQGQGDCQIQMGRVARIAQSIATETSHSGK